MTSRRGHVQNGRLRSLEARREARHYSKSASARAGKVPFRTFKLQKGVSLERAVKGK